MPEYLSPPEVYATAMDVEIFSGSPNEEDDVMAQLRKHGGSVSWCFNPNTWDITVFNNLYHHEVDVEANNGGITGYFYVDTKKILVKKEHTGLPPVKAIEIALTKFLESKLSS